MKKIEEIRLKNLKSLHGKPVSAGGPTSEFLVDYLKDKGVSITKTDLSNIYRMKKDISEYLAGSIERAFGVPVGWLSEDHEFFYSMSPGDMVAYRNFVELPEDIRTCIRALIESIGKHGPK